MDVSLYGLMHLITARVLFTLDNSNKATSPTNYMVLSTMAFLWHLGT